MCMEKVIIHSDKAPKAIGPYSQAVRVGDFLFTAGQIALNENGEMKNQTLEDEVNQVMKNLIAIAEQAGTSLDNTIKTTIFMTNLNDFGKVNEIYGSYFKSNFPSRSTVQVAALPKDAKVEIEMVIKI